MFLKDVLAEYLLLYPNEEKLLKVAKEQVQLEEEESVLSRKNFVGHFTAAAFLVSRKSKRVLLLDHKSLGKMLQPGGHIEKEDATPLEAAYRELEEESGVSRDNIQYRCAVPGMPLVPFDIDTHAIPENPKKGEPEHYHHDARYLFIVDEESEITLDETESTGYEWTEWHKFAAQPHFVKVAKKIEKLISVRSASHFFEKVYERTLEHSLENLHCVAVLHILPSTYDYILFLRAAFNNKLTVFAKPKSIDQSTFERLKERGVEVKTASREIEGSHSDFYLSEVDTKTDKVILMDIGAYFIELAQQKGLPIIGIVEDTENGHQKYEAAGGVRYNVYSAARSPLKDNEDRLVGESVVHAVDSILRADNILIDYCRCAVIGYGKVGSGVAGALMKKNIQPKIVEKNPQRLVKAVNDGGFALPIREALRESRVIFCATGMRALSIHDFRRLRNGAYLASVTSSDDEFNLDYLRSEYTETRVSEYVTKYEGDRNYFYLMNEGNAVNFIYNAAIGPFIHLVQAEMLAAALKLADSKKLVENVQELAASDRDVIAESWLGEFTV